MNLCRPDANKSCAACCGLYNVPDGTRSALYEKLRFRTHLFMETPRTVEALLAFASLVRVGEDMNPLDQDIHVCEFTGFVDADYRQPGCLLHPLARGNEGMDLRGLCYYGSLACKTFFCPAWQELDPVQRELLVLSIDDWHLYGLVITDLQFVRSVFNLLEKSLGRPLDRSLLLSDNRLEALREMLEWKDSWPFKGAGTSRRSRYYFRDHGPSDPMHALLESVRFTFDMPGPVPGEQEIVEAAISRFVAGK